MSNEVVSSISNNFQIYFAEILLIDKTCSFWRCKENQSVQEQKLK